MRVVFIMSWVVGGKGGEKLGIYNNMKEKIFRRQEVQKELTQLQMLSSNGGAFFSYNGKLYRSDLIQAAIRPYANHVGKLTAKHVQGENMNHIAQIKFLLEEPNDMMTMQQLISKAMWDLKLNGNAFIHISFEGGAPVALHNLSPNTVDVVKDRQNQIYLKMYFGDGTVRNIPYKHVIHLRGSFGEHEFFGDNPAEALIDLLDIVHTTETGIKHAIKNNAVVRWLVTFKNAMREEDIKKKTKEIQETFMSMDNEFGGVAAVDAKYDLTQVKNENSLYVPDNHVQNAFAARIKAFFGVSDAIINNTYTEDEFASWWEAECSPIIKQLSEEFTRKLFSRNQRSHGNKIVFDTGSLMFASYKTKLGLTQLADRGVLSLDEYRAILNLPSVDRDRFIIRREYGGLDEVTKDEGGENDGNERQSKADAGAEESDE